MELFKVTHERDDENETFRIVVTHSEMFSQLIVPSPKVVFTIMYCTYNEDEISPLLDGDDFYYIDGNFELTQKDGMTTFKVADATGSSIEISIPFKICSESLKVWAGR